MSWSKLSRSGVMSGPLQSLCLPCELPLAPAEASGHVAGEQHRARLAAAAYAAGYQRDRVRQVKQGYFCEFCNKLFGSVLKVAMHVSGAEHCNNKGLQQLKLQGNEVVMTFDSLLLDEDSWHGLVGTSCVLCNMECQDKQAHKTNPAHVLNLIQTNLEFDSHGVVYRKDNDTFYCLICKALFPLHTLEVHYDNADHVNCFKKCCQALTNQAAPTDIKGRKELKGMAAQSKQTSLEDENNELCEENEKVDASGYTGEIKNIAVTEVHKDELKKAEEKNKCDEASGNTGDIVPPITAMENALHFAKRNKLRLKWGKTSAYCNICKVTISSSLTRMKEHVAEATHRNKVVALPELITNVILMKEFIVSLYKVKSMFTVDYVVNEKFCLDEIRFHMLYINGPRVCCHVCDATVNASQINNHLNSSRHSEGVNSVVVLHKLESEFVREVRPGIYHCGFCNFVEGSGSGMLDHLKCVNHKNIKTIFEGLLRQYLPGIAQHRNMESVRSVITLMELLTMN